MDEVYRSLEVYMESHPLGVGIDFREEKKMSLDFEKPELGKPGWGQKVDANFEKVKSYATRVDNSLSIIGGAINNKLQVPLVIPEDADLNSYTTSGMFFCNDTGVARTILNMPLTGDERVAFSLLVEVASPAIQTLKFYWPVENAKIFTRSCADGRWGEWKQIATAGATQEFELPLASGISVWALRNRYSKKQFGEVKIVISVQRTGISFDLENETLVANLPAGFRPTAPVFFSVCGNSPTGYVPGFVLVSTGGGVYIYFGQAVSYVMGNCSYVTS